jgi:hypothetical protein
MFRSVEEVRALVARSRPQNLSEGYPLAMRVQVGAWLRDQYAAGAPWSQLGPPLGVSSTTASNWAKLADPHDIAPAAPAFVPVHRTPTATVHVSTTAPVLTTPNGYRVEGLDTHLLLHVLRELG